jgi:hypothetical protein
MSDAHCPHCGADRTDALACPVCELRYDVHVDPPAPTALGRLWQSGRLALGLAGASLLVATATPFAYLKSRLIPNAPEIPVSVAEMAMQSGPLARDVRSFTVLAIPFAAAAMVQFLFSRTTGRAMRASRPVIFVLAVLPLVSVFTGFKRLQRGGRFDVSPGVAGALVLVSAVLAVIAGTRFGRGVAEARPRRSKLAQSSHDDDDDE